jgi:hypothetical protein
LKHGPEKTIKGRDDRGQVGKLGPPRAPDECHPLDLLLRVVCEFAGQSEWTVARDLDAPARERRRDASRIVSPSKVRVSASRWISKKSFIRLFASASRTIASVFSAIEVSGR